MMTPKEAATYLALSVDVMYEMIDDRRIPYVLKGNGKRKLYTIDRLDLDRWIDENKVTVAA